MGRVVDVQVEAAVGCQDAVHFEDTHAEPAEERGHILAGGELGRFDHLPDGGPVVLDRVHPFLVDIFLPAPAVLEFCAGGEAVGGGVEVAVLVEGRVGGDQLDGLGVHAAQEGEVVAVVEGAVGEVGGGHLRLLGDRWV